MGILLSLAERQLEETPCCFFDMGTGLCRVEDCVPRCLFLRLDEQGKNSTLNTISSIMIFKGLRKELGVPAIIIYNRGSQELVASPVMK